MKITWHRQSLWGECGGFDINCARAAHVSSHSALKG